MWLSPSTPAGWREERSDDTAVRPLATHLATNETRNVVLLDLSSVSSYRSIHHLPDASVYSILNVSAVGHSVFVSSSVHSCVDISRLSRQVIQVGFVESDELPVESGWMSSVSWFSLFSIDDLSI